MTPTMCFHLVFALGVQSEDTAFPLIVIEQNVGLLKKLSQMLSTPSVGNLKVVYNYIVVQYMYLYSIKSRLAIQYYVG